MTYTDKHIVESYAAMLENLSPANKVALIELLAKSINKPPRKKRVKRSFEGYVEEKSAEDIIADIRASRISSSREITF